MVSQAALPCPFNSRESVRKDVCPVSTAPYLYHFLQLLCTVKQNKMLSLASIMANKALPQTFSPLPLSYTDPSAPNMTYPLCVQQAFVLRHQDKPGKGM